MLNDELWFKLREIMLQHGIYDKPNLRMIFEAMLYRMRVGCPWRDLPSDFGCWNSIYQQFNRWSSKNKLMYISLYGTIFESVVARSAATKQSSGFRSLK
jgi:transposase